LRQLLAAIAAAVLVLSVISSANFVGYRAFADEDKVSATFGEDSEIELEIDDELEGGAVMGEISVETKDGDMEDGDYAVSFSCVSPELEQTLDESLEVEDGEGDLEGEVSLVDGSTHEGCEVTIGDLSVALPSFTVQVNEEEDEDESDEESSGGNSGDDRKANSRDDDDEDEDDDKSGSSNGKSGDRGNNRNATSSNDDERDNGREDKQERKVKLEVEDDGVEIEVELDGMTLADGAYDAAFTCDSPSVNMTFADSFEVEDGEGEFEKEIALANGTYSGCQLEVDGTVMASFRTFTVTGDDVEEKRSERRHEIVSTANATRIHERHVNANPSSPGNYTQGSDYVLAARGSAEDGGEEANATINATMSVWKSTRALILLDIIDGTVKVGNQTYDVAVGYALYSTNGAMRIVALVVDGDSGEVLKLKLRGGAEGDDAEFPVDSGDSLDVSFEGNSGQGRNNSLDAWELELEGTVEAA